MNDPDLKIPRYSQEEFPCFFDDPAIDQMMTFLVELATEVSVVFDRVDTVERLLETKGTVTRQDIESYRPPAEVEAQRTARRSEFLKRVFRMHPVVRDQRVDN